MSEEDSSYEESEGIEKLKLEGSFATLPLADTEIKAGQSVLLNSPIPYLGLEKPLCGVCIGLNDHDECAYVSTEHGILSCDSRYFSHIEDPVGAYLAEKESADNEASAFLATTHQTTDAHYNLLENGDNVFVKMHRKIGFNVQIIAHNIIRVGMQGMAPQTISSQMAVRLPRKMFDFVASWEEAFSMMPLEDLELIL
ncbi:hypothetical protein ADUPG1_012749 [Aduncisulcus paluster]|uniref:Uncharacterized protein n=1 Tax=Aduncisulcus paluster TaxID=2918883 RepID=A0ABQ5K2D1_9EUKA|nr:hypothetical protein ADUPG1_012749 [Aduncisulcus paluster]|eukprot:gnl/Carplike_NY0171/1565_a2121_1170.p1 GENE.gnl/Carplike_NY0171/1565_a2121_1170~~gnl/Carplike_NY0171/1565_a2121_1170.p1  ORF type:complete len:197 (-),score=40.07 gnl/Carplike_NY0171/1565_a2121_1170:132-722(-)